MRILVVEDQQPKSARICSVLSSTAGVAVEDVVVVIDAASAKRELRARFYDLVIVDVAIPSRPDGDVQRDGGLRLVTEILSGEDFHKPLHVFGLTGFPDLAAAAADTVPRSVFSVQLFEDGSAEWIRALQLRVQQIASARDHFGTSASVAEAADVGVVCALDKPELSSVLSLPWEWSDHLVRSDPTIYYKGYARAGDRKVRIVAAACARMGLTAAAIATSKMISTFRPRFVVMVGIAAGVPDRVELGDVIVADPVWDWGSGKWTVRDGVLAFAPAPHQVDIDAAVRNRFRRLASDSPKLASIKAGFAGSKPASELRIHIGPLASGAAVLADGQTVARIVEQHRNLIGVDMEAYAVLAAAFESVVPRPEAFVVKGVVDFGGVAKDDKYQAYAAYASAHVLRVFVEEYAFDLVAAPAAT